MPEMTGSDTMYPMSRPAMAIIVPEVMIVGNARFIVAIMASRAGIVLRSSV